MAPPGVSYIPRDFMPAQTVLDQVEQAAGTSAAGDRFRNSAGFMPAAAIERVPIAAKFDIHALNL